MPNPVRNSYSCNNAEPIYGSLATRGGILADLMLRDTAVVADGKLSHINEADASTGTEACLQVAAQRKQTRRCQLYEEKSVLQI